MNKINAEELIKIVKDSFVKENAVGVNTSLQLNLSGEGGGQWFMQIKNQELNIQEGYYDDARAEVDIDAYDLLAIFSGTLDPLKAFFTGKVRLSGEQSAVTKMISLFRVSEEDLKKLKS